MADNESQPIVEECEQQIEKSTEIAEACEQQIEKSTEIAQEGEQQIEKSTEIAQECEQQQIEKSTEPNDGTIQPREVVSEAENGGAANPIEMNDGEDKTKGEDGDDEEKESEDDRKLFVGGLSWETQEKGLREYMSQYGEIASCIVKMDNSTGRSRGFGFVVFKGIAGLDKALEARPHQVDGRKIDSKKAEPQKQQEGKLFVGGVKPETEDQVIMDYFSQFGKIEKIERPQDPRNKKPKGFCFVTFSKAGAVTSIIKKRYHQLDEKEVECKFADPPHEGGGGGGRGRGRGRGGRGNFGPGGYPMFGGFGGNYGFDYGGGFGGPGYGNFGIPPGFGGYGGGMYGGGGYGYSGQQSNYGKSGRGGRFKPY